MEGSGPIAPTGGRWNPPRRSLEKADKIRAFLSRMIVLMIVVIYLDLRVR
jgi:hypothetical protein